MTEATMLEGVKIVLRGREFIMPPATAAVLEDHEAEINQILSLRSVPSKADMVALRTVVLAALKPNYPDLTAEELRHLVDAKNAGQLLPALMGVSLKVEDAPKGEGERPQS